MYQMLQNVEQWNVYSVHQQAWNIHTWVLLHTCGRLFMEINEIRKINKDCISYDLEMSSSAIVMGTHNFLCIAYICNQLMIKKVLI